MRLGLVAAMAIFSGSTVLGGQRVEWCQPPSSAGVPLVSLNSGVTLLTAAAPWRSSAGRPLLGMTWWGCFSDYEPATSGEVAPPGDFEGDFDIFFWSASGAGQDILPDEDLVGYLSVFPDVSYDWTGGTEGAYVHRYLFSCPLPWAFQTVSPGETYFVSIEANYGDDPQHPWAWWPSQTGLIAHPVYAEYGNWDSLTGIVGSLAFNLSGAAPAVPGDYGGDGTADLAVFRPSNGLWKIRALTCFYFGTSADLPVPQDYDGDGTWDAAYFRSLVGLWKVRGLTRFYFGIGEDIPVSRDYNGDGTGDYAFFRASSGFWNIRGLNRFYFGREGDIPVPADFNGDRYADPAFFRPPEGLWKARFLTRFYFGEDGDNPLPADYDGNGTAEAGTLSPTSSLWKVRGLTSFYLGQEGDLPLVADIAGDGTSSSIVERDGLWILRGVSRLYFGREDDVPVTNPLPD